MRGLRWLVAAALIALAGAHAHARAPLKVGILTELSGPFGLAGSGERDGFLLFLKNSGGKLGGRDVQTVIEDTANDPAVGIAKAKKLIESDKIDVLIGPLSSAIGAAIKAYVVSQKMPTFIEATVDEIGDGKYIFRTSFSANAESYLEGYLPGKAGYKKAIAIAPNFNAGEAAVRYFEKGFEAGGDAVRFIKQYADFGAPLPLYGFTATVDETPLPAPRSRT